MGIRLEKMKFYVTNGTKNDVFTDTYEGVLRTIREMKDFIGKEAIVLNNTKTLEELEKILEELNIKNKDRYEITVIRPTIIKYQDKEKKLKKFGMQSLKGKKKKISNIMKKIKIRKYKKIRRKKYESNNINR